MASSFTLLDYPFQHRFSNQIVEQPDKDLSVEIQKLQRVLFSVRLNLIIYTKRFVFRKLLQLADHSQVNHVYNKYNNRQDLLS